VSEPDRADRLLVLEQVDHAPVGDLGDGELRDRLQCAPVLERAGELDAGAEQEVLRLLRPLLRVDVGRRPDPEVDLPVGADERDRPTEVPAVAAVRGAESVLDLEGVAGVECLLAAVERRAQVVGMDDADPLVSLRRTGRKARVVEPAAVVVRRSRASPARARARGAAPLARGAASSFGRDR
jgi:hypothetical protein